jgi:uracil-DNA glycosylase
MLRFFYFFKKYGMMNFMNAGIKIEDSWKDALKDEFEKPYFKELTKFVHDEYKTKAIYPPPKFIFNAFNLCSFEKTRVVILGQDPYHGAGQAHGLCFSVPENIPLPPSLKNIYKEIQNDLEIKTSETGNLERWSKQGVLLLNATLTVRAATPGSHQHQGWEDFTGAVIAALSEKKEHLVFLLWGKYAQEKGAAINHEKHLVLTAAHPSPFSAYNGFFGCKHFSKTNEYLKNQKEKPIVW